MSLWSRYADMRDAGLIGINARNARYTLRENDRRFYPRVDDKLLTKRLLEAANIPTPALYGTARTHSEVAGLIASLSERDSFVLKPAHGAMGDGIIVISGRDGDRFVRPSGRIATAEDLHYHALGIVSGLYALGGQPDVAFVEERLELHPDLRRVASLGVPDIRVVVFRGVPVMAMTRLPTARSDGRANLHQGAVGAGINIDTGRTNHAVLGSRVVRRHPDTRVHVVDMEVPDFPRALDIAVRASDQTGLGYVGADVVIDARYGPVVLELNARPGLGIQIANLDGLRTRLDAIEAQDVRGLSLEERIALGRKLAREAAARMTV